MIPATTFVGRTVAVFGLGRSGLATARALAAGGAKPLVWDDGEASRAQAQAMAAEAGFEVADLQDLDWEQIAALVLAPGVPLTHPAPHWTVNRARAAGVEVIGDTELFCRERAATAPGAPLVAITGTNGKSTTTALIAHVLRELGADVQMGGNIGVPILSLEPPARERVHVIEFSSYQIDLTPSLAPTVGILLNITPDHLDRHGTMENYAAVKERLVAAAEVPVVGMEDKWGQAIVARLASAGRRPAVITYAASQEAGASAPSDATANRRSATGDPVRLVAADQAVLADDNNIVVALASCATLKGRHNAFNAAAAFAAASALGFEAAGIAQAMLSFPGLAHRLELIGRWHGVAFYNDSKATNADSTATALASFSGGIHWILGGRAKDGGIATLEPFFSRIAHAYLIGEASEAFAETLDGRVAYEMCSDLEGAVTACATNLASVASTGADRPVVVFSPACASFDQFPNFEVRGDKFCVLARALPDFETEGRLTK